MYSSRALSYYGTMGFGDDLYLKTMELQYPVLVPEIPPASVRCCPEESLIAEKWWSMVNWATSTPA